jgi:hypothetical protein
MSSHIEKLKRNTLWLADKSPKLKKIAASLFEELEKKHKNNIEALLPIEEIDMGRVEIRWNDVNVDDVEVEGTWSYTDPGTSEVVEGLTRTELDKRIEEVDDELDHATGTKEDNLNKLLDALHDAEETRPELMWNYSWRPYNEDANLDLANQIPQLMGVTYKEDKYVTLSSCGQDNGPALMAYVAIEHKVIPPGYVKYLTARELEWTLHVIGVTWTMKAAKALGVEKQVRQLRSNITRKRRAAAKAAAALEARRKAIRETPMPEELRAKLVQKYTLNPWARWDDSGLYEDPELLEVTTKYADAWEPQGRYLSTAIGVSNEDAKAARDGERLLERANDAQGVFVVKVPGLANLAASGPLAAVVRCPACGGIVRSEIHRAGMTLFQRCGGCGANYEVVEVEDGV